MQHAADDTRRPAGRPLVVDGLTKSFGERRVLDGVGFTVAPGRILGFLGRNGAGKTTTMRCVFGLMRADAGAITYGGAPVDDVVRQRFGYMPEERGLYPKMRVGDQLTYFGHLSGMSRADARRAAMAWLERLDLADRATARVDQLSHGNQQRVQLAAALVHGPEVLVLDEPFSGLDPIGVESMGRILREAAAAGSTILFSSHQLDLVEDLCQDVAIIDGGRVVVAGDLARVREGAGARRVEIVVDGRLWAPPIAGVRLVDGGAPHYLVPASAAVETLLDLAREAGTVSACHIGPPSLTDVFHQAVAA